MCILMEKRNLVKFEHIREYAAYVKFRFRLG